MNLIDLESELSDSQSEVQLDSENEYQTFNKEPIDKINDHIMKNLKTNIVKRPTLR